MTECIQYQRVRIHAVVTLNSELHIGSGQSTVLGNRANNDDSRDALYDSVCLDHNQQPYLPASTLRGLLYGLARTSFKGEDWVDSLFGEAHSTENIGTFLRIHDAFQIKNNDKTSSKDKHSNSRLLESDNPLATRIVQGVSIDPVRQVVEAHKLFQFEVIPEGAKFNLVLECDEISEPVLRRLHALLNGWQDQQITIGRNHLKGSGLVDCCVNKVEVADQNSINHWLLGEASDFFFELNTSFEQGDSAMVRSESLTYQFQCQGMLLVNDPDRVIKNKNEYSPQSVYSHLESGRAVVPGRAIKGLLRSHARKILVTMLIKQGADIRCAGTSADTYLEGVFGSKDQASKLSISNALSLSNTPVVRKQAFIAVDRFTGGVKDGALFQVEGVLNEVFKGDIALTQKAEKGVSSNDITRHWWKGLLCLVLRDMMQGDGYLGWGKSKGFGRFLISSLSIGNHTVAQWEDMLTIIEAVELERWISSLGSFVEQAANKIEQGECV